MGQRLEIVRGDAPHNLLTDLPIHLFTHSHGIFAANSNRPAKAAQPLDAGGHVTRLAAPEAFNSLSSDECKALDEVGHRAAPLRGRLTLVKIAVVRLRGRKGRRCAGKDGVGNATRISRESATNKETAHRGHGAGDLKAASRACYAPAHVIGAGGELEGGARPVRSGYRQGSADKPGGVTRQCDISGLAVVEGSRSNV